MPENSPPSASQLMVSKMNLEADVEVTSGAAISEGIENRILAAATDEDVFAAANAGLASSDDYVNVPLMIRGFRLNKSGYTEEGGLPVYMVIDAINLEEGTDILIGCGSRTVQTILWRVNELERLEDRTPLFGCALTSKTTSSGNTVKALRPLTAGEKKLAE